MITSLPKTGFPVDWTFDDLRKHLGGVAAHRIRMYPPPGLATKGDVLAIADREGRLYELVDGTLVEKVMGAYESLLAVLIAHYLHVYLEKKPLGQVLGSDGTLQILSHMVRIPDVAFISWDRLPKGGLRRHAVPKLAPNLAVEVLSEGNKKREMSRKLKDYFRAGVQLVWYIDPQPRTAVIYRSLKDFLEIDEDGELDGGEVLPGFTLSLRKLFAHADRQGPK